MIRFMVAIASFFIACFTAIIFLCACVLALCVLDYTLDLDIKEKLNEYLGERKWAKNLRNKVLKIFNKYDTPSVRDLPNYNELNNKPKINSVSLNDDAEQSTEENAFDSNSAFQDYINDHPNEGKLVFAGFAHDKAVEVLEGIQKSVFANNLDIRFYKTMDGNFVLSYKKKDPEASQ